MIPLPSPADLRRALRGRARSARYVLEDAAYAARRLTGRVSSHLSDLWHALSVQARALLTAAVGGSVVLILLAAVLTPSLPCGLPGGEECHPEDDAIALVPADSIAYLHADTDPDTQQYDEAAGIAERLPTLTAQLIARLPGPSGGSIDYGREVAPWLGGEAALALIRAGGGEHAPTLLLEVGDEQGAERYVEQLGNRGAEVGGFVVVGRPAQVARVVDTESSGGALGDSEAVAEVREELPDPRLAELYLTSEGIDELLGPGDPLGPFEIFVNAGAARAAGAALVAGESDLELAIHSELDPERTERAPGFLAAFPRFEPQLEDELSETALAYLALGDPGPSIAGLLEQAAAEVPSLARGLEDVGQRLGKADNVSLEGDLLPLLDSQAAVAIEPAEGDGRQAAGVGGVPFVSLIVDDVDEDRATEALANLQRPLAAALDPGRDLESRVFDEQEVDGVEARSLRISPAVELTYAVVDGKLVISTDPAGVSRVQTGDRSLEDSGRFAEATEGFADDLSALMYLDLAGLLGLAEQAGLGADPAYAPFSADFRTLEGLGVAVERSDEEIDSEIRLTIGE